MKGKRFTEEQIIGVLKETESGGMTVSEARRLKQLEAENSKLKRLLLSKPIGKPSVGFWPTAARCGKHGRPPAGRDPELPVVNGSFRQFGAHCWQEPDGVRMRARRNGPFGVDRAAKKQ